jgi:hypothetical protein
VELSIHRFIAIFWAQYISLYHYITISRPSNKSHTPSLRVYLIPKSLSQAGPNRSLSSDE